jgi:hypothetical protein
VIVFLAAAALAQDDPPTDAPPAAPPSEDPRDADIFGAPAAEDPRDADIFGASTSDVPPVAAPPVDAGLPGGALRTDAEIAAAIATQDRRFVIGGLAFLRAQADFVEGASAGAATLGAPSFFDLYGDARPNDRIRFYTRGRLYHDPTVLPDEVDFVGDPVPQTRVVLDQMWLNTDIARKVFVTIGRQRVRWGVGRLWNPTDFLAPSALDSLAVFDERLGVSLVKLHVPFEKTGTNLYFVGDLEGASRVDAVGGALRVEQIVGPGEIALSGEVRKDNPQELGAQASFPLGPLDLKGEVAVRHGVTTPFWTGSYDIATLQVPTEVSRKDDWIPQALVGAELGIRYSSEDTMFLGVEYFWNEPGYSDASLYPWLLTQGQFVPFYLGQHYVAAYVLLSGLGPSDELTLTATGLSNLSDRSGIARVDGSVRVLTELTVNGYGQVSLGETGGEFAFGLDIEPIPGLLEDGLVVPRPVALVGAGAQLRF